MIVFYVFFPSLSLFHQYFGCLKTAIMSISSVQTQDRLAAIKRCVRERLDRVFPCFKAKRTPRLIKEIVRTTFIDQRANKLKGKPFNFRHGDVTITGLTDDE